MSDARSTGAVDTENEVQRHLLGSSQPSCLKNGSWERRSGRSTLLFHESLDHEPRLNSIRNGEENGRMRPAF
jgi:hypothetical protein